MSKEYLATLALFITPMIGNYFTEDCASQIASRGVTWGVAGASAAFLIVKRWLDGRNGVKDAITPLGFYKK